MQLSTTTDFAATLDELWLTCGSLAYVQRKYVALGAIELRIRHFAATDTLIEVDLERVVRVDRERIPRWMRRWVGERQTLRHHTQWHRAGLITATAEIEIAPINLPVHARATGQIYDRRPHSTRMALRWTVRSDVPIVADRVEAQFGREVLQAMREDQRFTDRYVASHGDAPVDAQARAG